MAVLQITELELDSWEGIDLDNSVLQLGVKDPTPNELARLTYFENTFQINRLIGKTPEPKFVQAKYVPFRRQLKFGAVGNDVFAIKRALAQSGVSTWGEWGTFPRTYGSGATKHVKTFQQKHGLHVDGIYGVNTQKKLEPFFDAYGAFLLKTFKPPVLKTTSKRDNVVAAAMFGYENRASIHYTESSWRMYGVRNHIKPPGIPRYEDCSSFATWCYYVAGLPDPNGYGYDGLGYTGTLTHHGTSIALINAKPGDLVFYGGSFGIPSHVAIYVGNNRVVSHGGESGPDLLPVTYRGITEIRSYI